jgi:hypothetical protein
LRKGGIIETDLRLESFCFHVAAQRVVVGA